jgi:D-alanyl-D-alanine carboxypeptidase
MLYILNTHSELLEVTTKESLHFNGTNLDFKNTNKLLEKLPLLLGGKTGFDDLAGGNLIVAVNKGLNHPIIIAVLGSSLEGRFKDVETLYNRFLR